MEGIDIEKMATWGFASGVAIMLLRFLLVDLAGKLSCIKDTLLDMAQRIERTEQQVDRIEEQVGKSPTPK